jgi:hypothetical protein
MTSLLDWAERIAAEALPQERVVYGPWAGSMRSKTADKVPREYIAGGSNFLYVPRTGHFRRRLGQVQRFDTFGAAVGLLPALWTDAAAPLNAKARWMEEFVSDSLASDGVQTLMALVTKEAVAAGLDDGRFSQVYIRDQVANTHYTYGSEYGTGSYPALGSAQPYKVVPLWYDSGDGGLTRGTAEFARRFFFGGSRRFLKVGRWHYFPSLLGTPSRALIEKAQPAGTVSPLAPNTDINVNWGGPYSGPSGGGSPGGTHAASIATDDDDTNYIAINSGAPVGANPQRNGLNGTVTPGLTWTVTARVRALSGTLGAGAYLQVTLVDSAARFFTSANYDLAGQGTTWTTINITVDATGTGTTGLQANSISIEGVSGGSVYLVLGYVSVASAGVLAVVNRLIPSGPLPPLHAGTLASGAVISSSGAISLRPDADVTDGAWLGQDAGTSLFSYIDESTQNLADYITSPNNGAACTIGLGNPGFTPSVADVVTIKFTERTSSAATGNLLTVQLLEGATIRKTFVVGVGGSTSWGNRQNLLTAAQIASITDWDNLRILFSHTGSVGHAVDIAQVSVEIVQAVVQTQGGWKGSDRFYYSVAYRFEDGSVWATCQPRPPSSLLTSGLGLFTVDETNPAITYDRVVWSNIPIGPHGCVGRVLLRTPKISAVADDNLQLDPFDLRVIWEIKDNTTTTYDDYYGTDESLTPDAAKAFIRFDHMMPPRARYIFGGDMRVCHSYGGQNPCAIIVAPVGRAADYDLNLADDNAAAYSSQGSYLQVQIDTAGAGTLVLIQTDGTSIINTLSLVFTTHTTLQRLVDRINDTSFATNGQQWRAQLAPGANPDATTLSLTPHSRAIASCVVSGQTITRAAGGLSKAAVGNLLSGTGVTTGALVSRIDSDTQLTFTGTITPATITCTFYTELGDVPTVALTNSGYQRVICGALPGFLYFTESYLDDTPLDKQTVWMTVASPGQAKSAANNFSGRSDNRFTPPDANAGISMGGGGVDQGFVVPYANQVYAIRNVFQQGSGIDSDYRIRAINLSRGCCAWNTVVPGNRFVPYLTPEGVFAADLDGEIQLSEHTFLHAPNITGDFAYEVPLCEAAAAADTDAAYASARIMRGALWINYRASGSHPNRQVAYDFSTGSPSSGLASLVDQQGLVDWQTGRVIRRPGDPWGWSVVLVRSVTAMAAGRRADGLHLYGWNDQNAGSTGDGRIDEIETSETDNGTAIVGSVETPWERLGLRTLLSAQEATLEHSSPVGSTGFLDFHRGRADTLYSLTPSTSDTLVYSRDVKMLPQPARAAVDACFLGYRQTAGAAREVRTMELRAKALRGSLK